MSHIAHCGIVFALHSPTRSQAALNSLNTPLFDTHNAHNSAPPGQTWQVGSWKLGKEPQAPPWKAKVGYHGPPLSETLRRTPGLGFRPPANAEPQNSTEMTAARCFCSQVRFASLHCNATIKHWHEVLVGCLGAVFCCSLKTTGRVGNSRSEDGQVYPDPSTKGSVCCWRLKREMQQRSRELCHVLPSQIILRPHVLKGTTHLVP